ncbi:uncharacterized protein LOC131948592 [Physella acuta]|uniref:uncharacterized protein LOC131948592 n=1 Tax=Physella acuta TaxID=109671 RepID=UPI0027DD8E49|nr:uncharacterized protein LOC131948592 [Physella acuta]
MNSFLLLNTIAFLCLLLDVNGNRANNSNNRRRRRLCGSALADAYDLICSQSAQNGKRSYQPADVPEAPQQRRGSWGDIRDAPDFNDPSNEELSAMVSEAASKLKALEKFLAIFRHRRETHDVNPAKTGLARFTRQTSNIVVECCLNPCSITDIMGYCHAGYTPPSNSTLSELERNLGFTTMRPATQRPVPTQPPSTTTSAYPPAQVNRGRTGISNPDVFFVTFGNQATRSPLIQRRI